MTEPQSSKSKAAVAAAVQKPLEDEEQPIKLAKGGEIVLRILAKPGAKLSAVTGLQSSVVSD